jgi:hypothetical protein
MRLFNQVIATGGRDNLGMLHSVKHGKFLNGRPVTPELVSVNDGWDVVVDQ